MDQAKWVADMLGMARVSFEAGMKSMDTFQQQAQKALDMTLSNASLMQDETKKAVDTLVNNMKKARDIYETSFEEGMATLESQISSAPKKK